MLNWKISPPQNQSRKLNAEVRRLAAAMRIPAEQLSDLLSAYIVAEDLALREIQQEFGVPLLRHVGIGDAEFDAVFTKENLVVCADVTFLVEPKIEQAKIDGILKKMDAAKKMFAKSEKGAKVRLLLALVTQLDQTDEARLRSSITKQFAATPVDVDIRLFDFEGLQKIYTI